MANTVCMYLYFFIGYHQNHTPLAEAEERTYRCFAV